MLHAIVCLKNVAEQNIWKIWQNTILQMFEIPEYIEHFYQVQKEILFQRKGRQSFCIFIGIHEICDNINRLLCEYSDKIRTIYVQKNGVNRRIEKSGVYRYAYTLYCMQFNKYETLLLTFQFTWMCILHRSHMEDAMCIMQNSTHNYEILYST